VVKVSYILTTCSCFLNFEFDIFDAGGSQCDFITSVTMTIGVAKGGPTGPLIPNSFCVLRGGIPNKIVLIA